MDGVGIGEIACNSRYTQEELSTYAKVIKNFNSLYYSMGIQTWMNTSWRGVKVQKTPTDMWVYQELIEIIKPDLIIETGSLFGGSALFMRDVLDKAHPTGKIISIDIMHEGALSEKAKETLGIEFYKGSSIDIETITYVKAHIAAYRSQSVMVILDSDHNEEHVQKEMDLYSPLVTVGSMLIVEDMYTSQTPPLGDMVNVWLLEHPQFKRNLMCEKYMLTFNRDGYLEREK